MEEWKPWNEWYDISSEGRVRSWIDKGGYLRWGNGRLKDQSVHKEVALLFIGPPPSPKHEIAHNNGVQTDNRVSNLRWATRSDNLHDRVAHGTNYRTHLNEEMVRGMREEHALNYGTTYILGKRYGVSQTTVARILRKETWSHVN